MSLKAALRIREQEAETDEPDTFVYVQSGPAQEHKYDQITSLCVRCLVHRASYNIPFCPGLLDPSIKFNVG
jgi:hypothetical protein